MSKQERGSDDIYDVAIVGYGPVGATLANLLGKEGLTVLVFERESSVYHQPRAGHMDGEVARIFQSVGLAERILEETYVNPGMQFQNAAGEIILDWPRPRELGPEGWHASYRFYQPGLEKCLRNGVDSMPNVDVFLRHEVSAIRDTGAHVELDVTSIEDANSHTYRVRYLVGCDGARSMVRKSMGIELMDLKSHQQWLILDVEFVGKDDPLPMKTIQYCDPERPVTMAKMVGNRRRWEMMLMEGESPEEIVKPETYWPLLSKWVQPGDVVVDRAVLYTFHSVIADRWRKGRTMLAGDACHQTPPFMGQGMCAGIRDAANLSWKLAAVLRDEASDALLDTYETERIPHVRTFIETAVRLGNLVKITDPEEAAARDARLRANPNTMKTPAPPLGPGLGEPEDPHAGERSRQIMLADGRRSDDVVGRGFGLFVRETMATEPKDGLTVVTSADPGVAGWLDELGTDAVLVRPDRYIMGVAGDQASLASLMNRLPIRFA